LFARFFTSERILSCAIPLAIAVLAVLIAAGGDELRLLLRYERSALAALQLWRLLTGHLVHLGPGHMLLDVAALLILTLIFAPYLRARDWATVSLLAVVFIDFGLYVFNRDVQWYVGLSGLLHGYWVAGCLFALSGGYRQALILLMLVVGKLLYEGLFGGVPMTGDLAGGPVVTEAHFWGALGGGAAWLITAATRSRQRPL
jgi:rhomboid family GlyGly-CTERM serine protease